MRMQLCIATVLLLACGGAFAVGVVYDDLEVNGHPGYLTAYEVSPDGVWDKVLILCEGHDTNNDSHPIDDINDDWQPIIDALGPDGWDIVLFDYVYGDIDIKINGDNLAHFIGVVDGWVGTPDYHLSLVGGSMGGIVIRTMFALENSNRGADTFVSIDSPHNGVYLSPWVEDLADLLIDSYAGHQQAEGQPEFNEFMGWMRGVEATPGYMANVVDPLATFAIALSNGEGTWEVNWADLLIHTKYHPVCSLVTAEGLTSDYMPYHSVLLWDDVNGQTDEDVAWNRNYYYYLYKGTSYFDETQANPQSEHEMKEYAVVQAVDFVLAHAPSGPPPVDTTPPVITMLGSSPVTLEVGQAYTDAGATASDNVDGDLTASIVTVNNVNTSVAGTYTVTYDVSDAAGNAATQAVRTVIVEEAAPPVDTTAPVLTLVGDAVVTVQRKTAYTELGATVYDEGDPNVAVVIGGDIVNTNRAGTYVVTYDATDASGNVATQITRTVNVVK